MKTSPELLEYRKEYYKKNKAKEYAYWKDWVAANPERRKAIVDKSRAKKQAASVQI